MKSFVQFGAGNIGRSFVGQLFSRAGYEVVFVDVDEGLVELLNARGAYRVVVKHPDGVDEEMVVENVRAVHGRDAEAVNEALAGADAAGTAVGSRALRAVASGMAGGLELRRARRGDAPLDIILAENLHGAAARMRGWLAEELPGDFALEDLVGLVETSIGKMVPIMRAEDLAEDPLWVFAEPYNRLIVDRHGFKNPIPDVEGLSPVDDIRAYVDRKLFIHNLAHGATAYLGYERRPDAECIHEVLEDREILGQVRECAAQSAAALCREYPGSFTSADLDRHIEDILSRFQNKALGDTVFRVGRDLARKLGKSDRLVGAMLLAKKHGLPSGAIARATAAAVGFRKTDAKGELFPGDKAFAENEFPKGLEHVLTHVSGLSRDDALETEAMDEILAAGRRTKPN